MNSEFENMNSEFENVNQGLTNLEQEIRRLVENLNSESVSLHDKVTSIERLRNIPNELNRYSLRIRRLVSTLGQTSLQYDDYEYDVINEQVERFAGRVDELEGMLKNDNGLGNIMDYRANEIVSGYLMRLEKTERHAKRLLSSLIYDFTQIRDINEDLNNLIAEHDELKQQAAEVISLINSYSSKLYTITADELEDRLTNLRVNIREIKRQQVRQYNNMVTVVNNRISNFKNRLEGLSEELVARINNLPQTLESCQVDIRSYNQVNYLESMNYNELVRLLNLTFEIEKDINNISDRKEDFDDKPADEATFYETLKAELDNFNNKIDEMENKFANDLLTTRELDELMEQFVEFELKLMSEHLSVDESDELTERFNKVKERYEQVKEKFCADKPLTSYDGYLQQVNSVEDKLKHIDNTLVEPALESKEISQEVLDTLKKDLESITHNLNELEEKIIRDYETGTLTDEQYNNLKNKITFLKDSLAQKQEKIVTFNILHENGFFDLLNGKIDGLESAITEFENVVNTAGEPINKENRKLIEKMYEELLKEISDIEENLGQHKEEDKEKYESQVARLNECKEKLDKINKDFRGKCPLHVKAIRSAKNFYKKHKKAVLIVTGLAALALVLSPVIIPAIMEGNLLIMTQSPLSRTFLRGMNELLGNSIGASVVRTNVGGLVWQLSNGSILSPVVTKFALLKGLALSVGGSTVLGAPLIAGVIMAIKNLNKKLEKKNKKQNKGSSPKPVKPEEFVMGEDGAFDPLEELDEEKKGRSR